MSNQKEVKCHICQTEFAVSTGNYALYLFRKLSSEESLHILKMCSVHGAELTCQKLNVPLTLVDLVLKNSCKSLARRFFLYRLDDISGVSGTGAVATGVQFPNGKCVVSWAGEYSSTNEYSCMDDVKRIHGHNGNTLFLWID